MPHIATTERAKFWEKNLVSIGLALLFAILVGSWIYGLVKNNVPPPPHVSPNASSGKNCFTINAAKKGDFSSATLTYRIKIAGRINMYSQDEYWFINRAGYWLEMKDKCELVITSEEDIGRALYLAGKKPNTIICFEEGNECK